MKSNTNTMKFVRQGSTYQMVIENGLDLKGVLKLDEALWVAMSAPTEAFNCDPQFLKYIDADSNQQIGSEEVKAAIRWLLDQLPNHAAITAEFNGTLPLSSIADNATGKALVASAQYILTDLGVQDKSTITLENIRQFQNVVKTRPLNGDGVLSLNTATVSNMAEMQSCIADAITATGGTQDIDGTTGVNEAQLNEFLAAIPAYLDWLKMAEIPSGESSTAIMPLGADTPALYALLQENAPQVEYFFKLCRLLSFDARLVDKSLSTDGTLGTFDPANPDEVDAYMQSLPLAQANPAGRLPLDPTLINPVYRAWWSNLSNRLLKPVLGDEIKAVNESDWNMVVAVFASYRAYLADKKGAIVEKIPVERLRLYQSLPGLAEEGHALARRDQQVADTMKAAAEVERLLLYRSLLIRFVNNFVSFPDLYNPRQRALFEQGALVIDGRWFNVAFPVLALAAHQAVAKLSNLFVLYVEVEKSPDSKITVAVPVTTGSKGNLAVGKRGIFFDLNQKEYPAKVVQVIENPVCLREALIAPFSKAWGMIEKKIESWSSASEKTFQGAFEKALTPPAVPPGAPPPAAPAAAPAAAANPNAFLGVTVAFAALGSAFAFISKTVASMSALAIWISVGCAVLALILPISLLAILKLRRQDLSTLLEGSNWAINARMRLSNKHRRYFSRVGIFPANAVGTPRHILKYLLLLLLLLILGTGVWFAYRNWPSRQPEKNSQEIQVAPETTPPADPAAPATPAAPAAPAAAPAAPAAPGA
jgi:hypothetical protein